MKIFVTGGTGNIGRPLVEQLCARGAEVSVLTRSPEKARMLPIGVRGVVGSIFDLDLLRRNLTDSDALFLNCELSTEELYQGILAADIAARAKLKHLVYLSGQDPDIMFAPPHCAVKQVTENVIRSLGVPATILRPNTFMQNDLQIREAILLGGVYPVPFGTGGVSRIDVRDIADAAAVTLTTEGHIGKTYTLAGPDVLTGPGIAAQWSKALGKTIRYVGDDLDAFEKLIASRAGTTIAHDLRMMYEHYQNPGLHGRPDDQARAQALLGRPLKTFTAFTEEMARSWLTISSAEKVAMGAKVLWSGLKSSFTR